MTQLNLNLNTIIILTRDVHFCVIAQKPILTLQVEC